MILSNQDLAQFVRQIPQSNQAPQSIVNICQTQDDTILATYYGFAQMLNLIGIVTIKVKESTGQALLQASSQTAKYTLMSLGDYIDKGEPIIRDWKTRGIQTHVLANGATFLHALEVERLNRFDNIVPSRYVKVAQVLIKRINPQTGRHELLLQFDSNANQFQFMGGRWSKLDGDDLLATMIREIEEELPLNNLPYPDAYQLDCLINAMSVEGSISTTFGALTHYTFWIYHMRGLTQSLVLQSEDRWLPIEELLDGVAIVENVEYPFNNAEIFCQIDANISGGLMDLATSFAFK